jgi:hypothetical protein
MSSTGQDKNVLMTSQSAGEHLDATTAELTHDQPTVWKPS